MMKKMKKPPLTIGATDLARLTVLAEQVEGRSPEIAQELLAELDRAKATPDNAVAEAVVRMGSTVTFTTGGETRTVTLVFPGEADIAAGKVSILTPIGTALLGLSVGQSMSWTARDGRAHELSVLDVRKPMA
ncbi:MAG: nucleoside diphosphate kinase regulator [Rhizobiaceae bacterium]|nr:nucleoside diphosphate kinase regulator [Rhizobiaceae bacterium]